MLATPAAIQKLSVPLQKKWQNVYMSVYAKTKNVNRSRNMANEAVGIVPDEPEKLLCPWSPEQKPFVKLELSAGQKTPRFAKQIFQIGNWKHPLTGQKLDFSEDFAKLSCADTNKFISDGNQCAFPDEHDGSTRSNYGWWEPNFEIRDGWVCGVASVPDPKDAELLSAGNVKFVSPAIKTHWQDAMGREYKNVMYHVCATLRPVTPGQGGFERVELSAGEAGKKKFSILRFDRIQENAMSLKNISIKLGLDAASDESAILAAIGDLATSSPEVIKLSASLEAAKIREVALKADIDRIKKSQGNAYILGLEADCAKTGIMLSVDQKKRVQAHLDADREEVARELGDAYLRLARATGTKPADAVNVPHPTIEADAATKLSVTKNEVASQKKMLESQGYSVKLTADGTGIAESIAPKRYDPRGARK